MAATAFMRMGTSSVHMVWTGMIGYGLAKHLFLPEGERPRLVTVLLPSILCHGLYDYSLSALQGASQTHDILLVLLLFAICIGTSVGSCCFLGRLTGGFCSPDGCGCCCAPKFWEDRFGSGNSTQVGVLVGPPQLQAGMLVQPAAGSGSISLVDRVNSTAAGNIQTESPVATS
eukprot:TRINITY_DN80421_c0_g1_i1.p1 TRINITY_DN80421_c0_g1~~TRINITY_DN80421_c0_g1_i1.p1  ORF type:complete len:173 (+),score=19.33 TRINITY_DN80421_c0_g1_i1:307-825(+)